MTEKLKVTFKKYFSKGPTAAIFVMCLIIAIVSIVAFSLRKTVTVIIDGKESKLITYKATVGGLLKSNGITLKEKDLITPNIENKVSKGDVVKIRTALPVKIKIDGKEEDVLTASTDVEEMLNSEGIKLGDEDRVLPGKDSLIVKDMNIEIVRVETKDIETVEAIPFTTEVKNDENMINTSSKTLKDGQNGEKKIVTRVVYENGQEVSRKVVSQAVLREPVSKLVAKGTMKTFALSRGNELSYKRMINARTTAYYAVYGVGKTYTASGRKAVRDENGYSTVAVDPRVIPLGTKMYIDGYGYAIAADTGVGVDGNSIDVFFNTYAEAARWGVKNLKVYILN